MQVVSGKDLLHFYKITKDTNCVNMASTCCQTCLCARNEDYSGNAVGIYPQASKVEGVDSKLTDVVQFLSFRSHAPDVEGIEDGVVELWIEPDGNFGGSEGWETVVGTAVGANAAEIPPDSKGESMSELMESIGAATNVMNSE